MKNRIRVKCLSLLLTISFLLDPHQIRSEKRGEDPDEVLLKESKVGTTKTSQMSYLKRRCADEGDLVMIDTLVKQLGDGRYRVREKAAKRLILIGPIALTALLVAERDTSVEVRRRAVKCIEKIRATYDWGLDRAVVRVLGKSKDEVGMKVLMQFLPYTRDEETEVEIWHRLRGIAEESEKGRIMLEKYLTDKVACRRAVAGCILGILGTRKEKKQVHKLLTDYEAVVRLRASQGLVAGRDKLGIPTLVTLINNTSIEIAWQAEELLRWIAGSEAPNIVVGNGGKEHLKRTQGAWQDWWKQHGQKVDLKAVEESHRRPLLFFVTEPGTSGEGKGLIWLCGCDGSPRWSRANVDHPIGVHLLKKSNSILLCENKTVSEVQSNGQRITEIEVGGRVKWQKEVASNDIGVDFWNLPNGNLMIIGTRFIIQIQERDREVVYDVQKSVCQRLECGMPISKDNLLTVAFPNREVFSFNIRQRTWRQLNQFKRINKGTILPTSEGGFVYIKDMSGQGKRVETRDRSKVVNVVEINRMGKKVWEGQVLGGITPLAKLHNGNMLIHCSHPGLERISEIDRATGKTVSQFYSRLFRVSSLKVCCPLIQFGFETRPQSVVDMDSVAFQISALKNKDVMARRNAAKCMPAFGEITKPVIESLFRALNDRDKFVRETATVGLHKLLKGRAKEVVGYLHDSNPNVRGMAIVLYSKSGEPPAAILEKVKEMFNDPTPSVRENAILSLTWINPKSRNVLPLLRAALNDNSKIVTRTALYYLLQYGREEERIVGQLSVLTRDKDNEIQGLAVRCLGKVGGKKRSTVNIVVRTLNRTNDTSVKLEAISALGDLSPASYSSLPELIKLLTSKPTRPLSDYRYYCRIFGTISTLGTRAEGAVEPVIGVMKLAKSMKNQKIRRIILSNSIITLGRIGRKSLIARRAVKGLTQDPDPEIKRQALRAKSWNFD
jgi:HEAT repeat protein